MSLRDKLVQHIKKHSYEYRKEPFKLSSGKLSHHYFDLKKIAYSPEGQYLIGNIIYGKIQELGLNPDAIGGLTMGADPVTSSVVHTSYLKGNPIEGMAIRKERKGHGLMRQIEGKYKEGDRVIIVDDVVTTGGSTIQAIDTAREHKLNILAAIVLLDRGENNGVENIESKGIPVYSILTIDDFK